jgi:hypothetical protein
MAGSAASDGKNLPVLPAALEPGHAAQLGLVDAGAPVDGTLLACL